MTKDEKSRRQFTYRNRRRGSKQKSKCNSMNKKESTWTLKLTLRTEWRIQSLINRSGWLLRKYTRNDRGKSKQRKAASLTKWVMRTKFVWWRKKKSWIWNAWRWSWSRNFKTPKPSKKTLTMSFSAFSMSRLSWWHHRTCLASCPAQEIKRLCRRNE